MESRFARTRTSVGPGRQPRDQRSRDQRGAVVVEAALVVTFLLTPILAGILTLGERLWHAQKTHAYAARIPGGAVSGTNLTCAELVDRVKDTVVANVNSVSGSLLPIGVDQVVVTVVDQLPTIGVVVQVTVTPPPSTTPSLIPAGQGLTAESTHRLSAVSLSTESC